MAFRPRLLSLALFGAILLSGCVETLPQRSGDALDLGLPLVHRNDAATRDALKAIAASQERLDFVAAPLLIKNQNLCKTLARPLLGITAKNKYSYSAGLAAAAQEALDLGEMLQVTGIMAGSGAARSGLQRGDVLMSAGNQPMPQGPNAEYDAPAVVVPLLIGQSSIKLTVLRNGKSNTISVPLTKACAFRVELGNADNINSYADGRRIMVTRGMLKFVRSDEELAFVIAREMAHNALGHARKLGTAAAARNAISSLMQVTPQFGSTHSTASIKPMPKEMDALADRLAIHMLARGGYRLDGVIPFWQRLAQQVPEGVSDGHTALHPATAQRLAAMEKSVSEIKSRHPRKKSGKAEE